MSVPSGANTCTPLNPSAPHPAADQTLPSTSQRMPSELPGAIFANMRPFFNRIPFSTSYTRMGRGSPGCFGFAGVHDVNLLLVGRKTDPIRLDHVAGEYGCFARIRIQAIDVGGKFESGFVTLVVGHDPVAGIGKPDRAVRMNGQIIRSIQRLALKAIHEHGDRAVMLGAGKPARIVLAGKQPSLPVSAIPVAVIRRAAKH